MKVLLVDDEPFILQGLRVLIDWKSIGCEIVATAPNGADAYEYVKNNHVDIIVTDIKMPEMNGIELLKKLREDGFSDIEVIILSGYNYIYMIVLDIFISISSVCCTYGCKINCSYSCQ